MTAYALRVLVAFDVFVNVVCGGLPDETISARCQRIVATHPAPSWRQPLVAVAWAIHWGLARLQRRHGVLAEANDLARAERIEHTEDAALGQSDA